MNEFLFLETSLQTARKTFTKVAKENDAYLCLMCHWLLPAKNLPELSELPEADGKKLCFMAPATKLVGSAHNTQSPHRAAQRQYFIYSNSKPAPFLSAASFAGQCVKALPVELRDILWRDWEDGWYYGVKESCLWINAVFELAWQRHTAASTLHETKWIWNGNERIPLPIAQRTGRLPGEIVDAPEKWYSVLTDFLAASIAAIDVLLSLGNDLHVKNLRFVFATNHHNPDYRDLAVAINKALADPKDERSENAIAADHFKHFSDPKEAARLGLAAIRSFERDRQKKSNR